jgi:hypothetical protein
MSINFESRFDRRVNNEFNLLKTEIKTEKNTANNYDDVEYLECDSAITATRVSGIGQAIVEQILTPSIYSECRKYQEAEKKEPGSVSQKNRRKKLYEQIFLCKKINQNTIKELKDQVSDLESSIKSSWVFKALFAIMPSCILSKDQLLNKVAPILYEDKFNKRKEILKECDKLELKFNEKFNEIISELDGQKWRPRTITKTELIDRIKQLIPNEKVNTNFNSNVDLNKKGQIKLNDDLDLIVTSKNNYYIVFKDKGIGTGTSKIVYKGLDLSKNKPIAISYIREKENKEKHLKKAEIEESTYLQLKGVEGIAKIRDFIRSKNQGIFISDLYEYGDLSKDLEDLAKSKINKKKHESCLKLIKTMYETTIERKVFLSDLKTGNVMLDHELNPVIIDLDIMGETTCYMPPEEFKTGTLKARQCTEKSVIWQLGLILYNIYYGQNLIKHLFPGFDSQYIALDLSKLTDQRLDSVFEDKNDAFGTLIRSMLRINPEERPSLLKIQKQWELAMQENPEENELPPLPVITSKYSIN